MSCLTFLFLSGGAGGEGAAVFHKAEKIPLATQTDLGIFVAPGYAGYSVIAPVLQDTVAA